MRKNLLNTASALFLLVSTPAPANYSDNWEESGDNVARITWTDDFEHIVLLVGFCAIVAGALVLGEQKGARSGEPSGPSESPEHYDQEASRTRAYARKLDAEATLAESQLRASLKQDELKEFQSFLQEKNSPRRRK